MLLNGRSSRSPSSPSACARWGWAPGGRGGRTRLRATESDWCRPLWHACGRCDEGAGAASLRARRKSGAVGLTAPWVLESLARRAGPDVERLDVSAGSAAGGARGGGCEVSPLPELAQKSRDGWRGRDRTQALSSLTTVGRQKCTSAQKSSHKLVRDTDGEGRTSASTPAATTGAPCSLPPSAVLRSQSKISGRRCTDGH